MNNKYADKTRQALLDSAMHVLIKKGYAATRLEDIALEAGLTRGSISYHFKNKLTVFQEALKVYMPGLLNEFMHVAKSNESPKEKIKKIILWLFDEERVHITQMLQQLLKGEFQEQAPELHESIKKNVLIAIKSVEEILKEGIDTGEFRGDIDPRAYSFIFNNSITGIIDNFAFTSDQVSPETMITHFSELFMAGIEN